MSFTTTYPKKTIWKFLVDPNGSSISLPRGAIVRHVGVQYGEVFIWAEVDPEAKKELRQFRAYGTGHKLPPDPGRYIGTFLLAGGSLVFHFYEEKVAASAPPPPPPPQEETPFKVF